MKRWRQRPEVILVRCCICGKKFRCYGPKDRDEKETCSIWGDYLNCIDVSGETCVCHECSDSSICYTEFLE